MNVKLSCGCGASVDESEKVFGRKAKYAADPAYCPKHGDVIFETPALFEAARLIDEDDEEWHDFCAIYGHLPDNVKHMPSVRRAFARWLEGEE